MSDPIKIEVNGVELEARPGEMLIAVTDRAGIYIPRFCYHEKLSVAANCRMCLVEVVNAPKPLPACATPVTSGMKVATRSAKAISAQKATMEFLLINHPLDCPICDQGGECELQDLAMGFGRGVSRFTERKRVVKDKDIGPLISTDMTRCIHCTRCVRFGQEIAGIQELGTLGRGERMQISTFIAQTVDHELSGNVIDLCPVGALNSKPFRFSARAWEMQARPFVSPHDCFGSNLSAHVLLGRLKRVVPQASESLNETWIADRDRFSYEGVYSTDRLETPLLRTGGEWRVATWEEALEAAARGLQDLGGGEALGALVSPGATVEEGYLLQRILRHLGSDNIDHRLRRRDFRLQDQDPVAPTLGMPIERIPECGTILLIGCDVRREVPMLAHRIRQAAMRGANVLFVNPRRYEYLFPVAGYLVSGMDLAGTAARIGTGGPDEGAQRMAELLGGNGKPLILLGHLAGRHPRFAEIRQQAAALAQRFGGVLGYVSEGANSAGLSLAGVLPHRQAGGAPAARAGLDAASMVRSPRKGLVLLNVEPEHDVADGERAAAAVRAAEFVVALTPYVTPALRSQAHVLLPIGTFAESAGTYVNAEARWQSFAGVARPFGESRPAWKVLRVLGNLLQVEGFGFESAEDVLAEVRQRTGATLPEAALPTVAPGGTPPADVPLEALEVAMYRIDPVVRRSRPLQLTREGRAAEPVRPVSVLRAVP